MVREKGVVMPLRANRWLASFAKVRPDVMTDAMFGVAWFTTTAFTELCIILSIMTIFTDESRPSGGFIPAETLVQNGIAGGNGTAGGTVNQPVLGFMVG